MQFAHLCNRQAKHGKIGRHVDGTLHHAERSRVAECGHWAILIGTHDFAGCVGGDIGKVEQNQEADDKVDKISQGPVALEDTEI